jgi:hypothetical protein
MPSQQHLVFGQGNSKLVKNEWHVSLASGVSCGFAKECKSTAHRVTGKITDGKFTTFRCFEATMEARSTALRNINYANFDILRNLSEDDMVVVIQYSLVINGVQIGETLRIHVGGDYFNARYFNAWVRVAIANPNIHFYGYTKAIKYWVECPYKIPNNLNLTASYGGWGDSLISTNMLKSATVVFHPDEAEKLGLEIDHDDSLAKGGTTDFALLLHGTQPAKSLASKAKSRMEREGIKFSYSRKV